MRDGKNVTKGGRVIPSIMATQHPDNAGVVEFLGKEFVNTGDEIEECYRSFSEMGADEYMWDWEGKFVDEAVVEKLFRTYSDFFQKRSLGKDIFLTFRIPNTDEENTARAARAHLSILTADDFAASSGFYNPPVFEVILPMTKTADQILNVQKIFKKTAEFEREVFSHDAGTIDNLNVIPLFETVPIIMDAWKVLQEYVEKCEKEFGKVPEYIRPFIARSDPAMNAGLLASECAVRASISNMYFKFSKMSGVDVYPILGTGSLPFRGGVNPEFLKNRLRDLGGVRTVTTQSAFRYDYPIDDVKKAYELLHESLPFSEPLYLNDEEINEVQWITSTCNDYYTKTVEGLAPLINMVADHVPNRRERIQHVGLFGYSRGVGKVKLPRAIKFTSALYSIGLPPEFIATGRTLRDLKARGNLALLEKVYLNLRDDILHAGKYFNPENLELLNESYPVLREYMEDVRLIEEILGLEIGPSKPHHYIHRNLTSSAYWHLKAGTSLENTIVQSGIMRKSLG